MADSNELRKYYLTGLQHGLFLASARTNDREDWVKTKREFTEDFAEVFSRRQTQNTLRRKVLRTAGIVDSPTESEKFRHLTNRWLSETEFLSDGDQIAMHPAHLEIIGLGKGILPLIFHELREHGGLWFVALRAITGENPVPEEHEGRVDMMKEDWLRWANEHGYS